MLTMRWDHLAMIATAAAALGFIVGAFMAALIFMH